jgi:hypothetical protein
MRKLKKWIKITNEKIKKFKNSIIKEIRKTKMKQKWNKIRN